jgi:hypothetical protein
MRCSVRNQLIQVVMRGVNTEPLYRSVQVTLGHCLLLEDKKFLGSQTSQPKKIPFHSLWQPPPPPSPSPSPCCLLYIHLFSTSLLLGLYNQSLSLFRAARRFLCNKKTWKCEELVSASRTIRCVPSCPWKEEIRQNHHQRNSCGRVVLEKLVVMLLKNRFPRFYGTRRFSIMLTSSRYWSLFFLSRFVTVTLFLRDPL